MFLGLAFIFEDSFPQCTVGVQEAGRRDGRLEWSIPATGIWGFGGG